MLRVSWASDSVIFSSAAIAASVLDGELKEQLSESRHIMAEWLRGHMLSAGDAELVLTPQRCSDVQLLSDSLDSPLDLEFRSVAGQMLRDRFGPAPD